MAPVIEGNFDLYELIELTAADTNIPKHDVRAALKVALNILKTKIVELGYAELDGFGSFHIRELAPESGKLPNGEPYSVGKRATVDFNPFKPFRDEMEDKTGEPAIL